MRCQRARLLIMTGKTSKDFPFNAFYRQLQAFLCLGHGRTLLPGYLCANGSPC